MFLGSAQQYEKSVKVVVTHLTGEMSQTNTC